MRITVFGAAGEVGSRVVAEALSRGHEVTAVVRDPARAPHTAVVRAPARPPHTAVVRAPARPPHAAVPVLVGDASDPGDVARLGVGQDLVISATRPRPGHENDLVTTAKALLAGLSGTGVRLLLVGGAAGLTVPGTNGLTVIDTPDFPPSWRPIALACLAQLEVCRGEEATDWTYASPPALLVPGRRTGRYRVGADELVVDAEGESAISMEDFAVALLDEAEHPRHRRARFTVGY